MLPIILKNSHSIFMQQQCEHAQAGFNTQKHVLTFIKMHKPQNITCIQKFSYCHSLKNSLLFLEYSQIPKHIYYSQNYAGIIYRHELQI